ncbi:hypothetical protein [Mucilaginibacter sp.]
MRIFIFVFLTISLLSVLASCSYKQDQLLFQQKHGFDTISTKPPTPTAHYQIHPQDILQIRNLQNISYIIGDAPSATATFGGSESGGGSSLLGQDFQVEEDGSVALPVIAIPLIRMSDINIFVIRSGKSKFYAATVPQRIAQEYHLDNTAIILNAYTEDVLHSRHYTTKFNGENYGARYYYYSGYESSGYYVDSIEKKWLNTKAWFKS